MRPYDAHEADSIERTSRFVRAHPDCFERTLHHGHVTGSAWVVDPMLQRALLTHHRKLGLWVQLGGHADGDRDVARVAMREAREESGLTTLRLVHDTIFDVDVHEIPGRLDEPAHLHFDVRFLLLADPGEPLCLSPESRALEWCELDALEALGVDSSVLRMAEKTRRRWGTCARIWPGARGTAC